ncbi:MAG: alpha-ketoacid dehydrogenase subunit beta [Acidobacteria bacterium]|nr:alpha-ketoacid dehydrogenase subunit beta [Acidobacteriota bacterium]
MSNPMPGRSLSFSLAINEALHQTMAADPRVILLGQGVKSPWYVGNTALGLLERFGEKRVIDTPVSENAMTGAAVGAAIAGMRPVVVHPRMDFMFYAFDPIINEAANWRYMSGGRSRAPVVFWGIINRRGEQAAQHSQAIQAMFAHVPGLKVVMPSTPADAKGLMVAAIRHDDPVVFIDDRLLHRTVGEVPEAVYEVPIGKGVVRREGADVTVAACSSLVTEALEAAAALAGEGIGLEVIDLRSVKPFDGALILESIRKTGRLVVADPGWASFGVSAEIAAFAAEKGFRVLKAPVARVALPDCPAPAARTLEEAYYPNRGDIAGAVRRTLAK